MSGFAADFQSYFILGAHHHKRSPQSSPGRFHPGTCDWEMVCLNQEDGAYPQTFLSLACAVFNILFVNILDFLFCVSFLFAGNDTVYL